MLTNSKSETDIEITADADSSARALDDDISTLATGAGIAFIGRVGGRGLHALNQVVLARFLGPEMFGLYALGWAVLRLAGTLASLGLERGVIRFASMYWLTDDGAVKSVLLKALSVALLAGGLLGLGIFALASPLALLFEEPELVPVLRLFSIAFPFLAGLTVLASATLVTQRAQYAIYSRELGQTASNLILVLAVLFLGGQLFGAVVAAVASFVFAFILASVYFLRLFSKQLSAQTQSAVSTSELILFSIPTAFSSIFITFSVWTDRLFLGFFRPASEVGVYQALSQVSLLFAITLQAINTIFTPMIADLYHAGEMKRLNELYKVSTKWAIYLSLPVYLTIAFAPREILTALFGQEYGIGALPLVVLATGQLINVATGSVGFVLIMTGHERWWMVISALTLLTNIIMNWLLVPTYGLVGSAVATALGISVLYLIGLAFVRTSVKLWPYDRRHLRGLLAASVAAAILFFVRLVPFPTPLIGASVVASISLLVFGGTLVTFGLDSEDRRFLRLIQNRLQGEHGPSQ